MRTLGYRTHVLLAVAASVGVIAALNRPWYAKPPAPIEPAGEGVGSLRGPADGLTEGVARWFSENAGTSGWDALGAWGTVLAALAALTAAAALACLVPALQGVARELLRYGALACVAVAAWKLVDQPGPNDALELRFGAFVAAGAALVALSSGGALASAPLRRPRAGRHVRAPAGAAALRLGAAAGHVAAAGRDELRLRARGRTSAGYGERESVRASNPGRRPDLRSPDDHKSGRLA